MAPRGVSTWKRPYTSIYNDNYRYGTQLYSDTLSDIEKRYSDSLSRTQLRSDRPDLAFTTFSGSNISSSPNPAGESRKENPAMARQISRQSLSPVRETVRSPTFENRLNETLKSAAFALDEDVQQVINTRMEMRRQRELAKNSELDESSNFKITSSEDSTRPKSLYDDASFFSLPKTKDKLAELDLDIPKSKRKTVRSSPTNGPKSSQWRDKSRDLQDQVDSLEKSMSNASDRLRNELSSLKSRYHSELSDLSSSVETTSQQANDLQRVCKRQASQIQDLQSAYEATQRNVQDALEEMSVWQNKCNSLKKEMSRLREEMDQAVQRSIKG